MSDWSARQYLKFEDERTRPSRDLVAQIPLTRPNLIVDLGCGPGNSTAVLAERFLQSRIVGLDSSPDMLAQARKRLPGREFIEADIAGWTPPAGTDVLFANAVFQWVPDHLAVLARLIGTLPDGGVLAVQMPDNTREPSHVLMREVARRGPWAADLKGAAEARDDLPEPTIYYDRLKPLCARLDIWHTVYNHVLEGAPAIAEWFKGTALRPYLDALDGSVREQFLAAYIEELAKTYPETFDGKCLLRFPRLFIVAVR
jgi:trans-aconitate 2-methyltransferase